MPDRPVLTITLDTAQEALAGPATGGVKSGRTLQGDAMRHLYAVLLSLIPA